MKTVALIPIKLGSKRVPGKNIKPFFDGTPLMHFIQKACLEAKNIDEVYHHLPYMLRDILYLDCSDDILSICIQKSHIHHTHQDFLLQLRRHFARYSFCPYIAPSFFNTPTIV